MLSRVADSIYWMARYVERAENVARFIDVNLNLSLDLGPQSASQWDPLIYTTGDQSQFYSKYGEATQEHVIQFLTFDEENPNSILSCLKSARENARTVREMLSESVWEELNKFFLLVRNTSPSQVTNMPYDFFQFLRLTAYTLEGATTATMSQGEAWHFRRMGRLLERADKTSRILDVKYFLLHLPAADISSSLEANQWAAVLKSASALEAYRKVQGRITPTLVAEFLLLDREFPRAVHYCLLGSEQSLLSITGGLHGTYHNPAEQRLGRLRSEFDYANIDEIITAGLHEFIDRFQSRVNEVGQAVHDTFFAVKTDS
jgi:uncharacterized alpha-E superfamily protein